MIRQKTLTVLTRIAEGREEALLCLLKSIQEPDVEANPVVPFAAMDRLHFARWSVVTLGGATDGETRFLLFACVFDGPLAEHLAMLCSASPLGNDGVVPGKAIDLIYGHCEGYEKVNSPAARASFLKGHSIPVHAYFIGAVGRTVEQIRAQYIMRTHINQFLRDPAHAADFGNPLALHGQVRGFLQNVYPTVGPGSFAAVTREADVRPGWLHRLASAAIRTVIWLLQRTVPAVLLIIAGFVLYRYGLQNIIWIGGLGLLYYSARRFIRRREFRDDDERQAWQERCREKSQEDALATAASRLNEDHISQNALTSMIVLKRGWFRWWTTRTVFFLINLFSRLLYIEGSLAGIRSIHFGRWAIVRRPRALLFMSDYDGSWESYLGDFISEGAEGMTAIWTNSVYFPRTRFLTGGGVTDEHAFKSYSRAMMSRTHVFYSAYKRLSVANITENGQVCAGVGKKLGAQEAWEWAQLLARRFS